MSGHWNYRRIRRRHPQDFPGAPKDSAPEDIYTVGEVYYNAAGEPYGYTEQADPMVTSGDLEDDGVTANDPRGEMARILDQMRNDVLRAPVLNAWEVNAEPDFDATKIPSEVPNADR